jgi:Rod binding domain-containing protein
MHISPITPATTTQLDAPRPPAPRTAADEPALREAFDQFVGQTFFGQMLQAMRKTVGQPAYFHGGRGEELFRQHLDQALAQEMTEASADTISQPMFELFQLNRR